MKVEDVVKKINPNTVIGVMERGLKGKMYVGHAVGAIQRKDLMMRGVEEIAMEPIENSYKICIYASPEKVGEKEDV